jgi:uncharacterized repeat protein (TIGR01451 family)
MLREGGDKMNGEILVKRVPNALLAAGSALLLAAFLLLLFSYLQVLAQPEASVGIEKTASVAQAGPGATVTYTIYAWDDDGGAPAYGAWITDSVPSELIFNDDLVATWGSFGFDDVSRVITWTGNLGDVWLTYTVQISPDVGQGAITNTAVVTGDGETVTDTAEVVVIPGRLEASKQVFPSTVGIGDQLSYTIRITNTGYGVVNTAWMTDSLPPEVFYAGGFDATRGAGGAAGGVVTWTADAMVPLEVVAITFAAEVTSGLSADTWVTNTAQITGTGTLVETTAVVLATSSHKYHFPVVVWKYPPIPVLNPIPLPDSNGDFTVSWVLDDVVVDQYVLQESTKSNFSSITREFVTTSKSKLIQNASTYGQTLYYRVRADDGWGEGEWSNVKSVTVVYYDNFSNAGSGWPDDQGEMYYDDDEHKWKYWRRGYKSGHYRFYIDQGGPLAWFYQPNALAPYTPPTNKYCVETRLRFETQGRWANMGLIFGANSSNTKLYSLCASYAGGGKVDWYIVLQDDYDFPRKACFGDYKKTILQGTNVGDWVEVKVGVHGDNVKAYVNGVRRYNQGMSGLRNMTKVGLSGGTYEVTPIDVRADYFKVTPNASCE